MTFFNTNACVCLFSKSQEALYSISIIQYLLTFLSEKLQITSDHFRKYIMYIFELEFSMKLFFFFLFFCGFCNTVGAQVAFIIFSTNPFIMHNFKRVLRVTLMQIALDSRAEILQKFCPQSLILIYC